MRPSFIVISPIARCDGRRHELDSDRPSASCSIVIVSCNHMQCIVPYANGQICLKVPAPQDRWCVWLSAGTSTYPLPWGRGLLEHREPGKPNKKTHATKSSENKRLETRIQYRIPQHSTAELALSVSCTAQLARQAYS